MENKPTSIYLPSNLKQRLIETARANGFEVHRGCNSGLPKFIGAMLKEHNPASTSSPIPPLLLRSLAPELRNTLIKLSKMNKAQQQRASQVLELIFSTWSEQAISEVPEEHYDSCDK